MKHQYIRQKNIRKKIKWMLVLLMAVSLSACGVKEEKNRQQAEENSAEEAVAKAIKRGRVGLKDPSRPIGSFLFLYRDLRPVGYDLGNIFFGYLHFFIFIALFLTFFQFFVGFFQLFLYLLN